MIGGRSKIGSALIGELVERGEKVRALTRSSEAATPFPAGVEAVSGDLADPGSLNEAMAGAARVFLLCGPTPDEVVFNRNAIDAAAAARAELVIRSSILGADTRSPAAFVSDHGRCDEYLRDTDVPFAIVRPNMFMQNVPENTVPSIDESGSFYTNVGHARISMVDTRDVAAVAAVLLTEPGHEGEELDVTGPEALSYDDVATKLSPVLAREVRHVAVGDDAVNSALKGLGLGDWMVGGLVSLFADYCRSGTDGYAAQVTDTVQRLTAHEPRSLDALLSEMEPAVAGR